MSDLPGLSGLTGNSNSPLSGPLQGGVGTPGSIARSFSSPASRSIFNRGVLDTQINNLTNAGAAPGLRRAIAGAERIGQPATALRDLASTGALRQIGDPSFRLEDPRLPQLRRMRGALGGAAPTPQPPPVVPPPVVPPPIEPPPPVVPSLADQTRAAFLGQNPLGERLRRGLAANFGGQNLFGGNRSLLGQTFAGNPAQAPGRLSPAAQAQQARNAFLAQNPLGNRLRRGLGANFQGENLFGGPRSRLGQVLQRRQGQIPQQDPSLSRLSELLRALGLQGVGLGLPRGLP